MCGEKLFLATAIITPAYYNTTSLVNTLLKAGTHKLTNTRILKVFGVCFTSRTRGNKVHSLSAANNFTLA